MRYHDEQGMCCGTHMSSLFTLDIGKQSLTSKVELRGDSPRPINAMTESNTPLMLMSNKLEKVDSGSLALGDAD